MTSQEYKEAERKFRLYGKQFLKCIEAAERAQRGYEYWKTKRGVKAFINKKVFALCSHLEVKLAKSYLNEQTELNKSMMEYVHNQL